MTASAPPLELIVKLADSQHRRAAALTLAASLGAEDLLFFTQDPELGVLLPAPGFTQTLPQGRRWRNFLAETIRTGRQRANLPFPNSDRTGPALGWSVEAGSVLVLLGGAPAPELPREMPVLLPLLAAAIRGERLALAAIGGAQVAREAATRAGALATALDATRLELEAALAEARAATKLRDDFLTIAAHELKTPITSLQGHVQLLQRRLLREADLDPERLRQSLAVLDLQAKKLVRLIRQLLEVSRLAAGKLALNVEWTDLTELIHAIAGTMQLTTQRHTIAVESTGPAVSQVDPLRIEQVFTNLIDNAIKYSPTGKAIQITVATVESGTKTIAVRDFGPGIAPEHRAKIFDQYYQVRESQHLVGLGIGLYVSRQIVELHGGQIEVTCPPDGGTCFTVTLP